MTNASISPYILPTCLPACLPACLSGQDNLQTTCVWTPFIAGEANPGVNTGYCHGDVLQLRQNFYPSRRGKCLILCESLIAVLSPSTGHWAPAIHYSPIKTQPQQELTMKQLYGLTLFRETAAPRNIQGVPERMLYSLSTRYTFRVFQNSPLRLYCFFTRYTGCHITDDATIIYISLCDIYYWVTHK